MAPAACDATAVDFHDSAASAPNPEEDSPPPYDSLFHRTFPNVQKITIKTKKLILVYVCIGFILLALGSTFVYHSTKADSIEDRIDQLKSTHIDTLRQKITNLESRNENLSHSLVRLQGQIGDLEAGFKVMAQNMKRLAVTENIALIPVPSVHTSSSGRSLHTCSVLSLVIIMGSCIASSLVF